MPLTQSDIRTIESLGYGVSEFSVVVDGIRQLRNIKGRCIFLDSDNNTCTIYKYRPMGCRLYPVIYDIENKVAIADPLCPKSHLITPSDLKTVMPKLMRLVSEIYMGEQKNGRQKSDRRRL